jgi:hypothetical protein
MRDVRLNAFSAYCLLLTTYCFLGLGTRDLR